MYRPFTLVIAGPIGSRFDEQINLETLKKAYTVIKKINNMNEVIISTYYGEIAPEADGIADQIIFNLDPGPDLLKDSPWPLGRKERRNHRNYSRLFTSSLNGIRLATNDIVIKTRIEIIPIDEFLITKWFSSLEDKIIDGKIGFFTESYSGIEFSIDGIIPKLPDIFEISTKKTLEHLWSQSFIFWESNKMYFSRKKIIHPIGSEQILGLVFLSIYYSFNLDKYMNRLGHNFISRDLVSKLIQAENNSFIWTRYNNSGFTENRFKGLTFIEVPARILSRTQKELNIKIIILLMKKIKHTFRRYLVGFKLQYKTWRQ